MDVEKTMAFILDMQASTQAKLDRVAEMQEKAEARADRADARMDRADARMDRSEARMDKFDKSLNGIRKLIQVGMKLMAENQRAIKNLAISQQQTERQLKAFLASMEKGRNGRNHA